MPLLLLQPTACATATGAAGAPAPAPSAAFSRTPSSSRLRCSHLPFAFPRLRKYGRRHREPVAAAPTSDDDEEEAEAEAEAEDGDYDEDDEEMAVDEEEFLATRPKPMGFGEGKTYATDIEEQLLREMGLGGARRGGDAASAKRREGNSSAKESGAVWKQGGKVIKHLRAGREVGRQCGSYGATVYELLALAPRRLGNPCRVSSREGAKDLFDKGVQVRLWNLPKKKNIHKDLKQAFKGFPGLLSIDPAVSANKKTRDPICKGFAYLKLESSEAATRFVEIYSRKPVAFGKVQKTISCCIVDGNSSVEPSDKASHAISQPRLKQKSLVAAS